MNRCGVLAAAVFFLVAGGGFASPVQETAAVEEVQQAASPEAPASGAAAESRATEAAMVYLESFEAGPGAWSGRAGTERLTSTAEATAGGSLSLRVSGRTAAWHGPSLDITKLVAGGGEFSFSARVRLASPEAATLQLSTQVGEGGAASYGAIAKAAAQASGGWITLEGKRHYSGGDPFVSLYLESPDSPEAAFYLDEVAIARLDTAPVALEKLAALKDRYAESFLVGTAVSAQDLAGLRNDLIRSQFNVVTAENAMKPASLQREKGVFTFADADALVNGFGEAALKVHGHTLAWHQQTPEWMFEEGLTPADALDNLVTHARTVASHFAGRVISWDVLNEAISDSADPADWRASLRKTPWLNLIGEEYIAAVYRAARGADPQAKLYYNDYNLDNPAKAQAVYAMIKELNEANPDVGGRPLIDGVGMQGHYNLRTDPEQVAASIELFASLGVEVSISELDVQANLDGEAGLSTEEAVLQGRLYAKLFAVFASHADALRRVTLWGLDDGSSWRAESSPLLFDAALQSKSAFQAAQRPARYLLNNPEPEAAPAAAAKEALAVYGSPALSADDPLWETTEAVAVSSYLSAWQGAAGVVRALWDEQYLYLRADVSGAKLNKASAAAYEQDSVEFFVDENAARTRAFEKGDGQYRVNFENEASFNPPGNSEGVESAAAVTGEGAYQVFMRIPFKTIAGAEGGAIGFDAQVNGASSSGARESVAVWNDLSGESFRDTSGYGTLRLVRDLSALAAEADAAAGEDALALPEGDDPFSGSDPGDGPERVTVAEWTFEESADGWSSPEACGDARFHKEGEVSWAADVFAPGDGKLRLALDFDGSTEGGSYGGVPVALALAEPLEVTGGTFVQFDFYYPMDSRDTLMRFELWSPETGQAAKTHEYVVSGSLDYLNGPEGGEIDGLTYRYKTITMKTNPTSGEWNTIRLDLHGEATNPVYQGSLFLDNVRILQEGEGEPIPLVRNTHAGAELPPLAARYADEFIVGFFGGKVEGPLVGQFVEWAPGNMLKADTVHPRAPEWLAAKYPDLADLAGTEDAPEYNFAPANELLDMAREAGYKLHGHVLAWYNQGAAWMKRLVPEHVSSTLPSLDGDYYSTGSAAAPPYVKVSKDDARRAYYEHITTVMRYYAEKGIAFYSWDVLNEEIQGTRHAALIAENEDEWRAALWNTSWLRAMTDDDFADVRQHFVYLLFKYAHIAVPNAEMAAKFKEAADLPEWMAAGRDAIDALVTETPPVLYFNEYGLDSATKARVAYNMVKELNAAWKDDPLYDGRNLIEGIAMQGQYHVGPEMAPNVRAALALFSSLVDEGLLTTLSMSELNLSLGEGAPGGSANSGTQALNQKQADAVGYQYALLFEAFRDYSKYLERVCVGGKQEPAGWLFFDREANAEPAYFAAWDPARFIAGHSYLSPYFEK